MTAGAPIAMPMIAFTRVIGASGNPQVPLPPAAASAVTVPRECPSTPTWEASACLPSQAGSWLMMALMSLTRSCMLKRQVGRGRSKLGR